MSQDDNARRSARANPSNGDCALGHAAPRGKRKKSTDVDIMVPPTTKKGRRVQSASPTQLQVHIVEDHDEALGPLLRGLGSKRIPFHGNILVHFDAHPDLLLPLEMPASDAFRKEALREQVSIASWILPLAYAGHLSAVVWFKAKWADQIPDGSHIIHVGRRHDTATLSTDSQLPYFVDELLSVPREALQDAKKVHLIVMTVPDDEQETFTANTTESIMAAIRDATGGLLLDVCLDFFGARNPFRAEVSSALFEELNMLFSCHSATSPPFRRLLDSSPSARADFLKDVAQILTKSPHVVMGCQSNSPCGCPVDSGVVQASLTRLRGHLKSLQAQAPEGTVVNPKRLLDIGTTTDLPHVECSECDRAGLMRNMRRWIDKVTQCKKPILVTIARSAYDGYTPSGIVDALQADVVRHVRAACGPIDLVIADTVE
eukprot:m.23410 g.23410  ORF g.23410 m.23410 type:complete len:431 (-) comp5945_c0_seq1:131-1423(-)